MNLAQRPRGGRRPRIPSGTALLFEGERISYRRARPTRGGRGRRAARSAASRPTTASRSSSRTRPTTWPRTSAFSALGAIAVPLNVLLAQPEIDARLGGGDAEGVRRSSAAGRGRGARRDRRAGRGRSGCAPLHLRHDRRPEGRGSDARRNPRSDPLRRGRAGVHGSTTSSSASRPSRTCSASRCSSRAPRRSGVSVDAALRAGAGARDDDEHSDDRPVRRADDVHRALRRPRRSAEALPPLRIAHVGGAAVPVDVARRLRGDVRRRAIHEGYGLTEMSGLATTFALGRRRKPGSVGRPSSGTEMRIANAGRAGSRRGSVPRPLGHPRLLERPGGYG